MMTVSLGIKWIKLEKVIFGYLWLGENWYEEFVKSAMSNTRGLYYYYFHMIFTLSHSKMSDRLAIVHLISGLIKHLFWSWTPNTYFYSTPLKA